MAETESVTRLFQIKNFDPRSREKILLFKDFDTGCLMSHHPISLQVWG